MCTVHDGEPELARLSRLRKSQIKGLLVPPARAPASSTVRPCAASASSASRVSCRSCLALPTAPATHGTGSRARIQAPSSEAGSRRGLGKMTRRKREIIGLTNERDFPHLVELTFPPGGFRSVFLEIDAFHRDRRIPVR